MNRSKITLIALLILVQQFAIAQTGGWKLAGNNLTGTEKLGSTNSSALNFITNNKTRMSLTGAGNLNFSSDQSSIQFALPGATPKPMMFMFPSGTNNTTRMVIAHSPNFTNFGLQYNDFDDRFDFLSSGTSIFNVNLGSSSVGVSGAFNVSGSSAFTGNVNITGGNLGVGTVTPQANLHVVRGSAGVAAFSGAPLVVENSINSYINLLAPNSFETGILFGNTGSNVDGGVIYNNPSTFRGMQFRTNGNITRMVLTDVGRLGIGTTAPVAALHLVHSNNFTTPSGIRIENSSSPDNFTLFTSTQKTFRLYCNSDEIGFFDGASGEYSSFVFAPLTSEIEKTPDVLQNVMKLDVKKYHLQKNSKSNDKKHYGILAQDVEKIFPEIVTHETSGSQNRYFVNYGAYGVIAIKAIQEQQRTIEEQQQKISTLEERIAKLEAAINNNISGASNSNATSKEISGASLEQNQPNPFNQSTVIRYHLPQGASGQINLYDTNGTLAKTIKTNESGQAIINGGDLKAGTYSYTLIVNGKITASKKLVVVK